MSESAGTDPAVTIANPTKKAVVNSTHDKLSPIGDN